MSFYWTMDEGGTATKLDSTVGLPWLLRWTTAAGTGLFSNGTHCDPSFSQGHGLDTQAKPELALNASISTGLSYWFWFKLLAYGALTADGLVFLDYYSYVDPDLNDNLSELYTFFNPQATPTLMEVDHKDAIIDTFFINPTLPGVPLDTWHMMASTIDTVHQSLNFYYDGVLLATGTDTIPLHTGTVAQMQLQNIQAINGNTDLIVDECGICLTGALTQAQITALYNGGAGVTWPDVTSIVPYP